MGQPLKREKGSEPFVSVTARVFIIALCLAAALVGFLRWQSGKSEHAVGPANDPGRTASEPEREAAVRSVTLIHTAHYSIVSTASDTQTKLVASAVEALHVAYSEFFKASLEVESRRPKLKLTLYKDREEFKQHNKSAPWAEAYYQAPTCFAYFAADERNPYHWMIHEATHQLNNEVAKIARTDWVDEGLATYFGTSQVRDGKLLPGSIDADTYPIWWLSGLELTGDLPVDIEAGDVVSLRVLVTGVGGPAIAQAVNKYYLGYWSLSHFLFHFDSGRYADEYRAVIAAGGTLEQFEKTIGPIDRIEVEWYGYLRHLKSELE